MAKPFNAAGFQRPVRKRVSDRTSSKHLHGLKLARDGVVGFPLLWLAFALGLVLWIPSTTRFWIGGCELGRLLYSLVAGGVFAGYALTALAITLWATWKGGVTAIAQLVGGLGLATGLAAFEIMVNEARTAPDLARTIAGIAGARPPGGHFHVGGRDRPARAAMDSRSGILRDLVRPCFTCRHVSRREASACRRATVCCGARSNYRSPCTNDRRRLRG